MRLAPSPAALLLAIVAAGCASRPDVAVPAVVSESGPGAAPATETSGTSETSETSGPAGLPDALADLNAAFRAAYSAARARVLAAEGPVILVMGDDLVLVRGDTEDRVRAIPPAYHDLKSIAHLPLAIYVSLGDTDGATSDDSHAGLQALVELAARVRASAVLERLPAAERPRQREILDACVSFATPVLEKRLARRSETIAFARRLAPLVLANAAAAARLQIDAYDRVVGAWRDALPPQDWARAKAVISGSQLPRAGALPVQYFARLFGTPAQRNPGEGPRVIYAESIWDPEKSLRLLGTHALDRRIATAFFDDENRMHRDLLADAAASILAER